ncbi:histidine phosphatase family protein [Pseudonocardia kujensis]|uniref:histidine phosphatase family protein n=1 Tax=Pseudonocardia kujensis TaxID=1128675 RepID=UPI001E64720F|nr:histidine phosphatase family protein [Pseudonocardia kujensis]MCE0762835.1 histidine phosphatase family protein [Pseudonocardia kujensis]
MSTGPVLHLVRHGESTWNAAGLLQGRTAHVALTARGRAQALDAARALRVAADAVVLSSPQRRAAETAAVVGRVLGLAVRECAGLREQSHGEWEGRPAAQCAAALAGAEPDWAPPGGETGRELHARAERVLAALPEAGSVVLVTHGETLRALVAAACGLGAEDAPREVPPNGAVVDLWPVGPGRWERAPEFAPHR